MRATISAVDRAERFLVTTTQIFEADGIEADLRRRIIGCFAGTAQISEQGFRDISTLFARRGAR